MSRSRTRLLVPAGLVALFLVLGLAVYSRQDSPDHRSDGDAAGGTSALLLYTEALGHPVGPPPSSFDLPPAAGLLFVFTPDFPYTRREAARVRDWISRGGTLVFADETADPELDRALGLARVGGPTDAAASMPGPLMAGVGHLAGAPLAGSSFRPATSQVALLRNGEGATLALSERIGSGRAIAISDPSWLTNGFLGLATNGRFAADLVGFAPAGAPTAFDEYHHGAAGTAISAYGWATTSWGAAMIWAVVALFAGLYLRGRRFGPLIPLPGAADRPASEYVAAVGELLRRAGARAPALEIMHGAARRALAERTGLSVEAASFPEALKRRAPELAASLTEAESSLARAAASDAALLAAARRLHDLAHPASAAPAGAPPSRGEGL